jgi:CPA1 family monovalent cation:H+ antiporter
MTVFQIIALLLTFAALGAYVNSRFLKLPSTIGLMVFALLISLCAINLNSLGLINLTAASSFVAQINFSDILLHGMLSFLLFAGALHVDLSELKKYRVIVGVLATVGVVIATFVTGTLVWWAAAGLGFSFPYIDALLFGALIAPTDPVAVLGILKETNLSKNFRVKIGSESLFNDGVGVVVFVILLNIADPTTPNLSPGQITGLLAWEGLGSVILGLTLGWIAYRLLLGTEEYKVEVLITLALAAGGYALAEIIHVSAPITMVVSGLVMGNHGELFGKTEKIRKYLDMFWELLDEILNTILFLLMGLEMMVITLTPLHLAIGLAAIIAMLLGRFISVALPVCLTRFLYKFERGTIRMLTWGGLRGGISIALALSLPAGVEKDLILRMTYIVVVFSVLFQGTTFRYMAQAMARKNHA